MKVPSFLHNRGVHASILLAAAGLLLALLSGGNASGGPVAILTVNTTASDNDGTCEGAPGDCTIHEAIVAANGTTGATITFNVGGCAPACTITPEFELPWITGTGTLVDGKSQPDYAGEPVVILDGSLINPAQAPFALILLADDVVVRGLEVRHFYGGFNADFTEYDSRRVEDNYIHDNAYYGIAMTGSNTAAVGNIVDGNGGDGIAGNFSASNPNHVVTGNLVTNNGGSGITTVSSDAVVSENVVTGNAVNGISNGFGGAGPNLTVSYNVVDGNGENGMFVGEPGLQVIGNTITGNGYTGLIVSGAGAEVSGNTISGNGTSPDLPSAAAKAGVLNGQQVIEAWPGVSLSQENVVFRGNTVSGNPGHGIVTYNGSGLIIGGTSAPEGNTIVGNGGDGIRLMDEDDPDPTGIFILRNSIHSNGGLGIGLGQDGVTANDPGDADSGPNNLQNSPALISASTGSLNVEGTVDSLPATIFRVEIYENDECDASGSGEGRTFITSFTQQSNGAGHLTFALTLDTEVPAGKFITATATNLTTSDTSEFSNCVQVEGQSTGTPTGTPTATPTPTPTATPTPTPTPGPPCPGAPSPPGGTCPPCPTPPAAARAGGRVASSTCAPLPPPPIKQGDVNCDGSITAVDSLGILRDVAGMSPLAQTEPCPDIGTGSGGAFGDVDCKNAVGSVDSLGILKFVAGMSPLAQQEPCTDVGDSPATGT